METNQSAKMLETLFIGNTQKTKIVATIGPASASKDMLKSLIFAGVDLFRLNFSHGKQTDHLQVINNIKELNKELGTRIAMLADMQGPKIRIGEIADNKVLLETGKNFVITTQPCVGTSEKAYLSYENFPKDVRVGELIMIDDGKIVLKVISSNNKDEVITNVVHGGYLSSKKGVNLPDTKVSIPSITDKDKEDILFALSNGVDWIALSFVRSANDITELKEFIKDKKGITPKIIAKIEKPEAIDVLDSIIQVTDGVMVARGDLGVELPIYRVPLLQKQIVKKCLYYGKPVIIATQMLESMITAISPTRAEVNDIANSVMDGADALMLSGETSVGAYPVKAVEYMQQIINQVEQFEDIYYKHYIPEEIKSGQRFISDVVCFNACNIAEQVNAKGIVVLTHSGYTAIKVSSFRPLAPIFAFTDNEILLSQLNLVWGVRSFIYERKLSTDQSLHDVTNYLLENKYIQKNDYIVFIASMPLAENGISNTVKLLKV